MQIHTLRVNRHDVGPKFPFDRVYLVKHDDRGVIEQLFRTALVMPVEGELTKLLKTLELDTVLERPFERDDDLSAPRPGVKEELAQFLKKDDWILVVPILTKWLRNKEIPEGAEVTKNHEEEDGTGANHARYIMSTRWYRGRHSRPRNGTSPLPSSAYLQLYGKKVRPICVACPRMIQHQNGECQVGEMVCYSSLSLGLRNHFQEGLQAPAPAVNVKELGDGIV